MGIDYEVQAESYERTRNINPLVYAMLSTLLKPAQGDKVLDFGCGTGNYLHQFVADYQIIPYGIEPAKHMCEIAQSKLPPQCIRIGDHTCRPFSELCFDKIYCTDVIHHIRQLNKLFLNLFSSAKPSALFCICTESSQQLSEKYWLRYFPEILDADLHRFHSVENIIRIGQETGWMHKETLTIEQKSLEPISLDFMERVRYKTLSVFHLITESAFNRGLMKMEADYQARIPIHQQEGYTFILFRRRK